MAVAAAEQQTELDEETSDKVKAYAAATDNVGLFFGEDIFIAIGSIVLIQQTLEAYGIMLSPLELAVWAIPTAIAAFLIHGTRLLLLDRSLAGARRSGHDHAAVRLSASSARCSPPCLAQPRSTGATRSASAMPLSGGWSRSSLLAGHPARRSRQRRLVLGLAGLAGFELIGRGEPATTSEAEREAAGERHGNRLVPARSSIVLLTAVAGTLLYLYTPLHQTGLFERKRETFILLCLGVLLALALIFAWLKPPPLAPLAGRAAADRRGRLGGGAAA